MFPSINNPRIMVQPIVSIQQGQALVYYPRLQAIQDYAREHPRQTGPKTGQIVPSQDIQQVHERALVRNTILLPERRAMLPPNQLYVTDEEVIFHYCKYVNLIPCQLINSI